ncbi:FAD binding domain-containing protein [Nakamurella flavida]|uniref:FAD binding domain-containing protein n=1 Tax=Nakamurella flavida TaxID=363630 RepID=A0A938YL62_9ACTN|nr:FAD binding domain-containing protein [Nakamurella flavida]MBM9476718.1 FAD binding domain-containing protein [Nakamurella flavida]MDP9778844.1 carbon-monoxide dehydrogenase medium subunit [Nakamurella flavida]
MKPAPFRWHGPTSVAQAVALLAEHGSAAKVLAGGQSLVPVMAMRLVSPAHLVDINGIAGLDGITHDGRGTRIGALARHTRVLADADLARNQPLVAQGLSHVAHATIRNRGTTLGSIVHADPAGEMTAVLALTGGTVTAVSATGTREIAAADFFLGPLESALRPDELAVQATFPDLPTGAGTAFVEVSRRSGDYALCGVGAVVQADPDRPDGPPRVRCAYLSVADIPVVLDLTGAWASGEADVVAQVHATLDPPADLHASSAYRRQLAGVLTVRVIRQARASMAAVAA